MTEPEKKKTPTPKGCLMMVGYVLITLMALFSIPASFVPSWVTWPLVLLILSSPFIIRKLLKQDFKQRYPYGRTMLVLFVVMLFVHGTYSNSPEQQAWEQKRAEEDFQRTKEAAKQEQETAKLNAETKRLEDQQKAQEVANAEASITHKIGESFKVGYTRYQVNGVRWQQRVGNEYFGSDSDARYFLVRVQIKNEDKESRMITPFKLLDESGSSYEESSDRMHLKDSLLLDSLNPGVQKRATLLFDVPPDHKYRLVVDGGFWSNDVGYVPLN